MRLHENQELFKNAVFATAQQKGLADIYIEKDYWVTLALYTIFTTEIGKEAVFKGGTSLSKCFQIIDRFSEDIDLVVLRKEGDSNSKMKDKIAKIGHCVNAVLPEALVGLPLASKTIASCAKNIAFLCVSIIFDTSRIFEYIRLVALKTL